MTRANTHPIHVTDAFKTATINTIKKILSSNTIIRHNNYDKNHSIAFDILGLSDIIHDGVNGFLVDCYDTNLMANKIAICILVMKQFVIQANRPRC